MSLCRKCEPGLTRCSSGDDLSSTNVVSEMCLQTGESHLQSQSAAFDTSYFGRTATVYLHFIRHFRGYNLVLRYKPPYNYQYYGIQISGSLAFSTPAPAWIQPKEFLPLTYRLTPNLSNRFQLPSDVRELTQDSRDAVMLFVCRIS